jgi:quercetin dioxygenase-like cupin family protein
MASDTIHTGLMKYAIGARLRRLRLGKSMGLLELSKHTGLSPGLLSKLERDVMHLRCRRFCALQWCSAWGWNIFQSGAEAGTRDRAQEGPSAFSRVAGIRRTGVLLRKPRLSGAEPCAGLLLRPVRADGGEGSALHEHAGVEMVYIVSGKLEVRTQKEKWELLEGDSIYFDSSVPHGYRGVSAKRTAAIVVTAGADPRDRGTP